MNAHGIAAVDEIRNKPAHNNNLAKFVFFFSVGATSNYLCFSGNVNNNNLSLTGWSGVLQSPLRDSSYPPDLSCEWLITVPEWKIVKLSFDSFDLPSSGWGKCKEDYVEILDGKFNSSLSKGKFCGYNPGDMRSTGRYMRVRFKSDSDSTYSSYSGFKASFIAEDGPGKSAMFSYI